MSDVSNKSKRVASELLLMQKYLPGKITVFNNFSELNVDTSIGSGKICFHNLQKGLKVFDFNLILNENLEIFLDSPSSQTFLFSYCFKGELHHQFNSIEKPIIIEQFQPAVAHSNKGVSSKFIITKAKHLILNVILVDDNEYFKKSDNANKESNEQLKELLQGICKKPKYFYKGGFNLKIAEQFKLLHSLEHTNDISKNLCKKGTYYIILADEICQFYKEINNSPNFSELSKSELSKIIELGDYIQKNPEFSHSISKLSSTTGLSAAKLQNGFKHLYQRTVSDFIRNIRLEKATSLIKTTDLTISEIVYTVGFTSRSYFCKIFRKKHFCSPKEFRNKYQY